MKTRSKLDPRNNPKVEEVARRFANVEHVPLVHEMDLLEVEKVFKDIPALEFPINSGAELIEKLGVGKLHKIAEVTVDPVRMIKYMPAYYFPIASIENFIEKLAELIRKNRKQVNIPAEMEAIKKQIPHLKFPIKTAEDLHKQLGEKKYKFQGRDVSAKEMIPRIPKHFFPFKSEQDFNTKIKFTMIYRPLIVKD